MSRTRITGFIEPEALCGVPEPAEEWYSALFCPPEDLSEFFLPRRYPDSKKQFFQIRQWRLPSCPCGRKSAPENIWHWNKNCLFPPLSEKRFPRLQACC